MYKLACLETQWFQCGNLCWTPDFSGMMKYEKEKKMKGLCSFTDFI